MQQAQLSFSVPGAFVDVMGGTFDALPGASPVNTQHTCKQAALVDLASNEIVHGAFHMNEMK